jgi:hypothetical protein
VKTIGVILIAIGLIGVIWGGVTYVKDRDTADIGPVPMSVVTKDRVSIPPFMGVGALIVGGLLVFLSTRKGGRLTG